jgi:hypothetical protein
MGTKRKSVLKKDKIARRNSEGLPRKRSQQMAAKRMSKLYTEFMTKKVLEERALREQLSKIPNLTSHEDLGLPEEIGIEELENWVKDETQVEQEPI